MLKKPVWRWTPEIMSKMYLTDWCRQSSKHSHIQQLNNVVSMTYSSIMCTRTAGKCTLHTATYPASHSSWRKDDRINLCASSWPPYTYAGTKSTVTEHNLMTVTASPIHSVPVHACCFVKQHWHYEQDDISSRHTALHIIPVLTI